ncbi:MAG: hypothetical protein LC646_10710 [Xanthomonadaceae bacterium]|nr:hypothetical protein [Xanthomonadaceae bacterium]
MSKSNQLKPVSLALGTAFALSLGSGIASADQNPFSMTELSSGYLVADKHEGKCGEGKCGGDKAKEKAKEGKCGEGKCGGDKAKEKAKDMEGKCGEGKCGGNR